MNPPLIVACNTGSSSCKLAFYQIQNGNTHPIGRLYIHWQEDDTMLDKVLVQLPEDYGYLPPLINRDDLSHWLDNFVHLAQNNHCEVAMVHRVVHGGGEYHKPRVATPDLIDQLHKLITLAPLHQPANLELVEIISRQLPDIKQVLCFDTGFHHNMPTLQQILPLPWALHHMGLRRYGFHGLSYEFLSGKLRKLRPDWGNKKQVYAHLGSGASVCAIKNWQSVDSSMGLTALDGLPMATRPGSIDPGALLYLMELGYSTDELEKLLYRESGLLGISGQSSDISRLLKTATPQAELAIAYFCWKTAQWIAQMAVTLGGLDVLVFSGGIGENQPRIIERICQQLAFIGVPPLCSTNLSDPVNYLSSPNADIQVLSVKTNEELVMVNHCHQLLKEHDLC